MSGMLQVQTKIDQNDPVYEMEKANGERLPNGARIRKKLKPVHLEMIALHLEGVSNSQIARKFKYTDSSISILLQQPLAKELIQRVLNDSRHRFNMLSHRVVDVLADGLKDGNDKGMQLRTIDRYHKMYSILGDESGKQTAEDVVQEILKRADKIQLNVEVNKQ